MDIQKFIEKLPSLYNNWGQSTITPKSKQFRDVLAQVQGMTTDNTMQLLNWAVECLEEGEIYCEIGCFQGATLIGALLNNPEKMAYAVDNFSEFDHDNKNFDQLIENLTKFNLDQQVFFCNQDFEEFFADLNDLQPGVKIGVYLYDGAHDYRSQLLGLLLARPFLADRALIIVDDSNCTMVKQANYDFLNSYEECDLLLDLPTPKDSHPSFWNGLQILVWDGNKAVNYSWQDIENKYRDPISIKLINDLHFELEFEQKPLVINRLMAEALELNKQEKFREAIDKYKEALQWDKYNPYLCNNIASLYFKLEKYQEALIFAQTSVNLNSQIALHQFNLGKIFEKLEQKDQAILAYSASIELNPEHLESYFNLAKLFVEIDQIDQAELIIDKIKQLDDQNCETYLILGDALVKQKQYKSAIEQYNQALILKPRTPEILEKIAIAYEKNNEPDQALLYYAHRDYRQDKYEEALPKFEEFFAKHEGDVFDRVALAKCYQKTDQIPKAKEIYRKELENNLNHDYLYLHFLSFLHDTGKTPEDWQFLEEYAEKSTENLTVQLEFKRSLPCIYQDEVELKFYKNKFKNFINYIDELREKQLLKDPQILEYAYNSIRFATNFLPQYQYEYQSYKDNQKKYGDFVYEIMKAKYPQWVKPLKMPSLTKEGKIKIGYLSDQIGDTSATKWIIGWLENCDRTKFEIHLYATSKRTVRSETTNKIRALCDYAYHIPDNLKAVAQQILKNELHILVFLALGMWAETTLLASLRLAPIQCTTWGHPSTSGLPTIDYFLSGELLEAPHAQDHYTEKLIRLPNLGISYPKPNLAKPTKTRADFGFSEEKILYLSCQLIFKYLPQYDYIYPQIALKLPQAQFIFVYRTTGTSQRSLIREGILYNRLKKAFTEVNLNVDDYCIFLQNQNREDYASLLNCVDVFLDTFAFSGGHTSFDAVAANLPLVTCPGELMLGRQSYGILKMLKVEDTIAYNEQEYIDIAVKLGLNRDWRKDISRRMGEGHQYLFNDATCVQGLEQFYQQVVQEKLIEQQKDPLNFINLIEQKGNNKKTVLHVGCGSYNPNALASEFPPDQWLEIRLDINPKVNPDILGTITDLSNVPNNSVDAIHSSHNLEHIEYHEVLLALKEFYRVLNYNGLVSIIVPDIQKVAEYVSQGQLEEPLFVAPSGPISAIDILYGFRPSLERGNHYMAHRTAFTATTLEQKLIQAGFQNIEIVKSNFNLYAKGYKL